MNQALHSLNTGYARTDEDRRDDSKARAPLSHLRTQSERDAKRHRSQGIPEVVDQISQQRDAATRHENKRLGDGRKTKNRQRERDRTNAVPRALDALINQTMRMPMPAMLVRVITRIRVPVRVRVRAVSLLVPTTNRRRETQPTRDMAMAPHMRMAMHQTTVAMLKKLRHLTPPYPTHQPQRTARNTAARQPHL